MSLRTQLPSQPKADVAVSAAPGTVLLSFVSKHKCSHTVQSVQRSFCAMQLLRNSPTNRLQMRSMTNGHAMNSNGSSRQRRQAHGADKRHERHLTPSFSIA